VPVHVYPSGPLTGPCVAVYPGSPWRDPFGHYGFDVVMYANPAGGNEPASARLEDLVDRVVAALAAVGVAPGSVEQPRTDSDAGLLSATMPVILRMK
jgi:hypothetical protein